MKQVLIYLTISLLLASFTATNAEYNSVEQTKVYVVMSSSSYAYHKTKNCSAVKKATHEVKEVTLEEAQKMGRKPCKICY
jgi:hypothetical protein